MNLIILIALFGILIIVVYLHRIHKLLERVVHRIELTDQQKHLEDMAIDDPEIYDGIMESQHVSRVDKNKL